MVSSPRPAALIDSYLKLAAECLHNNCRMPASATCSASRTGTPLLSCLFGSHKLSPHRSSRRPTAVFADNRALRETWSPTAFCLLQRSEHHAIML